MMVCFDSAGGSGKKLKAKPEFLSKLASIRARANGKIR